MALTKRAPAPLSRRVAAPSGLQTGVCILGAKQRKPPLGYNRDRSQFSMKLFPAHLRISWCQTVPVWPNAVCEP